MLQATARGSKGGYNAPKDQPYVPIGVPENVLPVIEGLKNKIEHS